MTEQELQESLLELGFFVDENLRYSRRNKNRELNIDVQSLWVYIEILDYEKKDNLFFTAFLSLRGFSYDLILINIKHFITIL